MNGKIEMNGNTPKNKALIRANYSILILFAFIILGPLYIIFNISFKGNEEYLYSGVLEFPNSFLNIGNFVSVFVKGHLLLGYRNSFILIAASLFGSIVLGLMVSYVLGRFEFKFRKIILNAFVLSAIIPAITTQVATFTVIKNLHLYNTLFAPIALYLSTDVIQIYIFLQFISKIPKELDESAMIDGASLYRIFLTIIIPLMKPAIVTLAIIKSINIYNDMYIPYLYMPKSSLKTVTTSIMQFSYDQNSQWNVMAAGIVVALLPTLILYILAQRHIISGISAGAVKA